MTLPLAGEKLRALDEEVARYERILESPMTVGAHCIRNWVEAPYHRFLTDLVRGVAREPLRLILSAPPRHGKTFFMSWGLPLWYLLRFPEHRVIHVSYEHGFAVDIGARRVRDTLAEHGAEFGVTVEGGTSATASSWRTMVLDRDGNWRTTVEGGMTSLGMGGAITGKGCNLLIIDDPIKNALQAQSEVIRRRHIDWWDSTASTRLEPGASVCIMACVAEGEPVAMADGTWKAIEDVQPGEKVASYSEGRIEPALVEAARCSGEDELLVVKTRRLELKVNARHPFLVVPNPEGRARPVYEPEWRAAGELQPEDLIVTAKATPTEGLFEVEGLLAGEDLLWLFGYLMGDGWVTSWKRRNWDAKRERFYESRSWCVCCALGVRPERDKRVADLMERFFGRRPKPTRNGYVRLDSNSAGRKLEALGLTGGAWGKRIPDWVFRCTREAKRSFILGLLEADGHEQKKGHAWQLQTVNFELCEDLRQLALTCGVRPGTITVRQTVSHPPNSPEPVESRSCRLSLVFKHDQAEGHSLVTYGPDLETIRIERVKSVEPAGHGKVYDLQVARTACFVAGGYVVHNTRWHEADLSGALITKMREALEDDPEADIDRWDVVNLPAVAGHGDPLGRTPGEALWPERYPKGALTRIKSRVSSYWWAAMYQGTPHPDDGQFFRRSDFKYYERVGDQHVVLHGPEGERRISVQDIRFAMGADTALSVKDEANYTVIVVWGVLPWGAVLLWDMVRDRVAVPDQWPLIRRLYHHHKPARSGIEAKASGIGLLELAKRENIPMEELRADADKGIRASPLATAYETGLVYHPMSVPWLDAYEHELLGFPNAAHDDVVDAAAHGYSLCPDLVARGVPSAEHLLPKKSQLPAEFQQTNNGSLIGRRLYE